MFLQIFEVVRILNRENSSGMINRFGWKRGCVGGVSVHQRKPAAQCHFHILQQLKLRWCTPGCTVKPALEKRRLYPVGGDANNWRDGKVKVEGI